MRRFSILAIALLLPALFMLASSSGCGKRGDENTDGDQGRAKNKGGATTTEASATKPAGDGKVVGSSKIAVKADSFDGVIKGQVLFDGTPPAPQPIAAMASSPDKNACLSGEEFEKINQTWIVNKDNKGVANVMVSLEPPGGYYFPIDEKIQFNKEVHVDQPHCAFVPHVQVIFPVYWNGLKYVPSGQKFVVKNSAGFPHNANYSGDQNIGSNNVLVPANSSKEIKFTSASRKPINLSCGFHPWMSAVVW